MAKEKAPKRFKVVFSETSGFVSQTSILLDTLTGVNYLWHSEGEGGSITPLLDKDGKPVITPDGKELV
ncbi:DUF6440 family protein [uncultured Ruminococcus sp.]|uniref:DUF6440 family protein n=1 Tax=uncultured Ruminococcus sp. TaxID=165186 RepID=UPI0025E23FAB|nr:DUF6440 family protein [uncultured Ruminococcus sp.]